MASLPPLPPLIQEWLNNPPPEITVYKYSGLGRLEKAIEPMADALRQHKTEEQLMFITNFPKKYIEDGGDIVRRRVYKSTRKMYFWEHQLLILQFRNCNQYCYVDSAIKWQLMTHSYTRELLPLKGNFDAYGYWPDAYLGGLHSARELVSSTGVRLSIYQEESSSQKKSSRPPGLRRWPTVAFETRTLSPLSVQYTDFGLDWWFYQSQGLTKIVVVFYIDHQAQNITLKNGCAILFLQGLREPQNKTPRSAR